MTSNTSQTSLVMSFLAVRTALGILGVLLPVALFGYSVLFKGGQLQPSVSDYYHTPMGDYFVGSLWAIGIFLIAYHGYKRTPIEIASTRLIDKLSDRGVSIVAGLSAIGVAMFPVNPAQIDGLDPTGFTFHGNWVHYLAAGIFFISMALFCLVLFPRGDGTQDNTVQQNGQTVTRIKWTPRNTYFAICGGIILGAMATLGAYFILLQTGSTAIPTLDAWDVFFWAEVAAILAFSAAWLEKGRALLSPLTLMRRINR